MAMQFRSYCHYPNLNEELWAGVLLCIGVNQSSCGIEVTAWSSQSVTSVAQFRVCRMLHQTYDPYYATTVVWH